MKVYFFIAFSILILIGRGQETSGFKITLTALHINDRPVPQLLDTIFLNSTFHKTIKIYTGVYNKDSSFIIPDIPIGNYWLLFSTKDFCVTPLPIVVCSKCDNQFAFFPSAKTQDEDCNMYTSVEISPYYIGGNKAFSKDFNRNLSKSEKKKLKEVSDFAVGFYLTKYGVISDPFFKKSEVSKDVKNIVLKGLKNLTRWRPAQRNGRVVDVEFSLDKHVLF